MAKDQCPYCYADLGKEDAEYFGENDFYCCPKCKRKGCDECMPGGPGCICPECEVGDTP